jgi:hypothetical protein
VDVPFVWFQYRSLGGYGVVPKKIWPNILTTGTCLLACELQTGRAFVRNKWLFILWTWIHYPLGGLWFQLLVGLVICSSGKSTERSIICEENYPFQCGELHHGPTLPEPVSWRWNTAIEPWTCHICCGSAQFVVENEKMPLAKNLNWMHISVWGTIQGV